MSTSLRVGYRRGRTKCKSDAVLFVGLWRDEIRSGEVRRTVSDLAEPTLVRLRTRPGNRKKIACGRGHDGNPQLVNG